MQPPGTAPAGCIELAQKLKISCKLLEFGYRGPQQLDSSSD